MSTVSDYPYKYEMHLHTSEASKCAVNTGPEMARAHKEAGYTGIVVTNHAWGGNTCIDKNLPYREWASLFVDAYYKAFEEGEKIGLQVFFGWEAGYQGTEFLIYGISPEWFIDHDELWTADIPEQYRIVHEAGGIVMHAHPYREEWYIPEIRLYPDYVDGVEIINATHSCHLSTSHNDPIYDERAIEYAKKHDMPTCAGSDVHSIKVFGGGICLREKVASSTELADIIISKGDYILTNGDNYFTKDGSKINGEFIF